MAHQIDETNGPAIAYVGDEPWHGLGQKLTEGADLATWKREAKLEWTVKEGEVLFTRETDVVASMTAEGTSYVKETVGFPDRKALYRSDNRAPLSIVSKAFNVVQPGDVIDVFRDAVEKHGFKMETAGALRGGRRIWALVRIAEGFKIEDDLQHPYVLLSTAYDATMATWARYCNTRVVCANTIAIAEDEKGKIVRVPHNAKLDFADVRMQLGLAFNAFERFKVRALKLAEREVTDEAAAQFLRELLGVDEDKTPKGFARILGLFQGAQMGAEKKSTRQTLWGLVQAVAEHVDHNPWSRSDDSRLDAAWFGYGNEYKVKAFKKALAIVEPAADEKKEVATA